MNPFEKMIKTNFDLEKQKISGLEERLVLFLLKNLLPSPDSFKIVQKRLRYFASQQNSSNTRCFINFYHFFRMYPSFPVNLYYHYYNKLHIDSSCFLPNLLNKFEKSFIYKTFKDVEQDRVKSIFSSPSNFQEEKKFGVIIPRKGIIYGIICHNSDDLCFKKIGTCLCFNKNNENLTVQTFKNFVLCLKESGYTLEESSASAEDSFL